jgi:quercetin dioxygenase-like cupin family protein
MFKSVVMGTVLAASAVTMASAADAPAVARKVLSQQDVLNNQTMATIDVLFPAGSREGRHTHSGPLMIYVVSGVLSLDNEGKPQTDYKAGEVAYIETGKIHEGINKGSETVHVVAVYTGPKAAPITMPAQ